MTSNPPTLRDIEQLTEEAVHLTALAADLRDGVLSWHDWDDELTCWDRQEVAVEESAMAARDAWERLEAAERAAGLTPQQRGAA